MHGLRREIYPDSFLQLPTNPRQCENFDAATKERRAYNGEHKMKISPFAGKPVDPSRLVDVSRLVTAYFTGRPDPGVAAQRVAFGTSGHRGSSFDLSFNEAHIL